MIVRKGQVKNESRALDELMEHEQDALRRMVLYYGTDTIDAAVYEIAIEACEDDDSDVLVGGAEPSASADTAASASEALDRTSGAK